MRISLISIGHCPSLALRNLRGYCLAHTDVRDAVGFSIHDLDIRKFAEAKTQLSQEWSLVTEFDRVLADILGEGPELVGFSCYLWNIEVSLQIAHLIKRLRPDIFVVFGGPDAGPRMRKLLSCYTQIDVVVNGDGEIPLLELVRRFLIDTLRDFSAVPSIGYREGKRVVVNPPCTDVADLSLLRNLYRGTPKEFDHSRWAWPHLLYETQRGCPYSCSYCMYGKKPANAKAPDLVVEELAALLGKGLSVEIVDPTFTTYKNRAKRILRDLSEREYRGRLYLEVYPDSIDEEMAELLTGARVGCVGMGLQTVSAEGLKAVSRPGNLQRFERAVQLLREQGIYFYVDVIYGLPGTGPDDFFATIDYLYSLGIDTIMIYRLLGLPGSPMMADADEYGLVFNEYPPYGLLKSDTWSLDDVLFCEPFQRAYVNLLGAIKPDRLRTMALAAGGVSRLAIHLVDGGIEDPDGIRRVLEEEFGESGQMDDAVPAPAPPQTVFSIP